jgi:hypothetical protein
VSGDLTKILQSPNSEVPCDLLDLHRFNPTRYPLLQADSDPARELEEARAKADNPEMDYQGTAGHG